MSRIGRKLLPVPNGVDARVENGLVLVKGPKGSLELKIPPSVEVRVDAAGVLVSARTGFEEASAIQGLIRSLIANMIVGVAKGYSKELEIQGVGFKASVQGETLSLALGFAAPRQLVIPSGVSVKVADNVRIEVSGPDKQAVGDFAARIRNQYPPEPYKGKGIRYKGEHVRRKVGKTVA